MFDKTPDKSSISQNNPPPPAPLCSPPPLSRSLFRALFRGGLILFHSLAVIPSSVNLSPFGSGITQQNIKETLILKRCQSSVPSCNAPFLLPLFFFGQLRKPQRAGQNASCASHLVSVVTSPVTGQRVHVYRGNGRPSILITGPLNQLGLGGTNHRSTGVAGHMKPHRVTDVKHHHGIEQSRYMDTVRVKSLHSNAASFSLNHIKTGYVFEVYCLKNRHGNKINKIMSRQNVINTKCVLKRKA